MKSWKMVLVSLVAMLCSARLPAQSTQSQTGYVDVEGGKLYYEVAGSGIPLVLIHGNFGDRRHWDDQFSVFAREFRVVRYDVRGFGKSSFPTEGAPYSHHEDLAALLRHLQIAKAHVIGLSMGSAIATNFVLAYPDMSVSLVSVGPWVVGYNSDSEPVRGMWAAFNAAGVALAQGGPQAAIEAWSASPFWVKTTPDTLTRARFRKIGSEYSFWAFRHKDPAQTLNPAPIKRLASIRIPVLAVTADLDMTLEVADLLVNLVPGARKALIPNAGHLMQMDNPTEFNRIVLAFLREVGGRH